MKAIVRRDTALVLDTVPDPVPAAGQTLVRSLACGICGSDLHCLHDMAHVAEAGRRSGAGDWIDASRDIIFGHEFCGEILEHGPGNVGALKPGTRVVSMPFVPSGGKMEWVGISNVVPGGFAERMLLSEPLMLPVPNGLPSAHAALVEPLAVGAHAVEAAGLTRGTPILVVGCGPVGLAVIAALKIQGHGPIVATDFSAIRRRMAERLGADIVVDPAEHSPHAHWESFGVAPTLADQVLWSMSGRSSRAAAVFECVGAVGIIQSLIDNVPPGTQIVVVGACTRLDTIEPSIAINKSIVLRFVVAYSAEEFARTLHHLAEGDIDASAFVTDEVKLDEVGAAFARLATPGDDVKIIVRPSD